MVQFYFVGRTWSAERWRGTAAWRCSRLLSFASSSPSPRPAGWWAIIESPEQSSIGWACGCTAFDHCLTSTTTTSGDSSSAAAGSTIHSRLATMRFAAFWFHVSARRCETVNAFNDSFVIDSLHDHHAVLHDVVVHCDFCVADIGAALLLVRRTRSEALPQDDTSKLSWINLDLFWHDSINSFRSPLGFYSALARVLVLAWLFSHALVIEIDGCLVTPTTGSAGRSSSAALALVQLESHPHYSSPNFTFRNVEWDSSRNLN